MIRLRLESDTNLEFDGWYVDDLRILACPPVAVEPFPTVPQMTAIAPAAPNPIGRGSTTTITFAVGSDVAGAGPVDVSLVLYDVKGREVRTLLSMTKGVGQYHATWNGTDSRGVPVAPGVYYARLKAGASIKTTRVVLAG